MTSAATDETAASANAGNQYGDYNGLSGYANNFFPSWTDRRNNASEEIWTARVVENFTTQPNIVSNGLTIVSGTCSGSPAGSINRGQKVTANVCLLNNGSTGTTNVVATLQPTGGIANPSAPQTYGALINGGGAVCRAFSFNATGGCGTHAAGNSRAIVIPGGTQTTGSIATEDIALLIARSNSNAVRNLGIHVAAGDLDGDGKADLIIGSLFTNTNTHPPNFEKAGKGFVIYGLSPPIPTQVVSRKLHSGAPFDIILPLAGNSGIECRSGGATNDYQLVFTFPSAVTFTGASVTAGAGTVSSTSGSGTTAVALNLTGVTNAQRIAVRLSGVSDGASSGNLDVPLGVLLGDAFVNSGDSQQTRIRSGQTSDATNFRSDVNTDGVVNSGDSFVVRSKSGSALP